MPSAVPRARGAIPAAPAPSNCAAGHARAEQLRWARAHAASQPSGRTPAIDISRDSLRATRPPASLRRLHPETSRHRELRDQCCAFCSSHYHSSSPCRRSTNRSSTPSSSRCYLRFRSRCDLRPSPALLAQPPREINTIAPDHSTPHAHHPPSAHVITMNARRR